LVTEFIDSTSRVFADAEERDLGERNRNDLYGRSEHEWMDGECGWDRVGTFH
jgi:hypothetical protein